VPVKNAIRSMLFSWLVGWGLTALSAKIGHIVPLCCFQFVNTLHDRILQ